MQPEGEKRSRSRLIVIAVIVIAAVIAFQKFAPDINVEQLLEDISAKLGDWTYVLVGGLAFLETGAFVGLVFPGETAVILGGAVAGQGETSIVITIAIVWFCAWAGDTTSFYIGSRLGREFVMRHGPKVRITPERFEQVESYFARHGGKTILVGRFIGLVRALAPFIAGSSGMRYRAFVPYSVLGTGLWATAFCLLGYFLSQSLDKATAIAGKGALVFGVVVSVIVAVVVVSRYLREAENRERIAARLESTPVLRRLLPQLRFTWRRLTPGGLGLEFTSLVAILSVALFVLIGYGLIVSGDGGPTPGDAQAIDVVDSLRTGWLTSLAKVITALGSTAVQVPLTVITAAVLAWRRRWPEFGVLIAAVVVMLIAVPLLKEIVDRPRPQGGLVDAPGASYPSGHAAHSVFYAWLALTIAVRVRPNWRYGTALIATGFALTALIGLSRVYLGVHYFSDVAGGWALGVCAFAGCAVIAMVVTHLRDLRQNQAAQ
ncbi:MAG TPA: bifunctional DedA family/phosphatase PAP2 family protein [Solirubrobacterales bacterium]